MKRLLKLRTFALLAVFMFFAFTVTSCMVLPAPGAGKPGKPGKHKGRHKKGLPHNQTSATPWKSIENSKV